VPKGIGGQPVPRFLPVAAGLRRRRLREHGRHRVSGPLSGVTILDLTRVLSGPYCTMMLADLGARIIKVEPPGGDDSRHFQPQANGSSAYFKAFNRGKESIALDLNAPTGRAVFERLLAAADVLVENFRPGVLNKLGYGATVLAERWPSLILASLSGFGQTGPDRGRMAYDLLIQAMGGVMSLTGEEGGGPARVGTSLVDIGSGMFLCAGILAALYERRGGAPARHVEVAMLDSQVAMLEHALMRAQAGDPPRRLGARFPTASPVDAYRTADGAIVLACPMPRHFAAAAQVLGHPEWAADPRFADNTARVAHQEALKALIEAAMTQHPTAHWDAAFSAAGVPCGPVREMADLLADPQLMAREMLLPMAGMRVAGNPMKLSGLPAPDAGSAPALDQHRAALLAEFGA
jgi:CoA:oxalate CoA-transferase